MGRKFMIDRAISMLVEQGHCGHRDQVRGSGKGLGVAIRGRGGDEGLGVAIRGRGWG